MSRFGHRLTTATSMVFRPARAARGDVQAIGRLPEQREALAVDFHFRHDLHAAQIQVEPPVSFEQRPRQLKRGAVNRGAGVILDPRVGMAAPGDELLERGLRRPAPCRARTAPTRAR